MSPATPVTYAPPTKDELEIPLPLTPLSRVSNYFSPWSSVSSSSTTPSSQVTIILSYLRLLYTESSTKPLAAAAAAAIPFATASPARSWVEFSLHSADFQQLLIEVKADKHLSYLWEHTIRYDYFSSLSRFTLRMVTITHESIRSSVRLEIERQLREIGTGTGRAAEYARKLRAEGSPRLQFLADNGAEPGDRHDPDETFVHPDGEFPVAILEVAFSQKGNALKYLADNYILGSDGNIRLVIGIKIDYKQSPLATGTGTESQRRISNTKRATFSIWRPRIDRDDDGVSVLDAACIVNDCEFRDKNGNVVPGPGIQLQLRDFATKTLFGDEIDSLTQPISIPSSALFEMLQEAETRTHNVQGGGGRKEELQVGTRKRRRPVTPGDEEEEEEDERGESEEEYTEDTFNNASEESDRVTLRATKRRNRGQ